MTETQSWDFPEYIVRQELIDTRGWPPELIDDFLKPDLTEPNPHNPTQQMRLYSKSKVFRTEKTEEFKIAFLKMCQGRLDSDKFYRIKKLRQIESQQKRRNHKSAFSRIVSRQRSVLIPCIPTSLSSEEKGILIDLGFV
jgi:hypothetical protein